MESLVSTFYQPFFKFIVKILNICNVTVKQISSQGTSSNNVEKSAEHEKASSGSSTHEEDYTIEDVSDRENVSQS